MATKTTTGPWTYRGVLIGETEISALWTRWTRVNGMVEEIKLVELSSAVLMQPERNTWGERDQAAVLPRLSTQLRKLAKEVSAQIVAVDGELKRD